MHRCAPWAALFAAVVVCTPAAAQVRAFPQNALRGELAFGQPPEVVLNGHAARLAPGARIRAEDNLIRLSGTLAGQKRVVHYTVDPFGLVKDVWILTAEERAKKPWPATEKEAATWQFDPVAQTWSKP